MRNEEYEIAEYLSRLSPEEREREIQRIENESVPKWPFRNKTDNVRVAK